MKHDDIPPVGLAFDAAFYRITNPALADLTDADLFAHYEAEGWRAGCDPSAFFSVAAYLRLNPDVAALGVEPFAHYNLSGASEGRRAFVSLWGADRADLIRAQDVEECVGWIDAAHLREARPDLAVLPDDALAAWYVAAGWRAGVDPSSRFCTLGYLAQNDDIAGLDICPLLHFVRCGQAEGRLAKPAPKDAEHADMAVVRPYFDADWYRLTYGFCGDGDAALVDFMTTGWRDGRNPMPHFDTVYYMDQYGDIASSGMNPFVHYVKFGRDEGRRATPDGVMVLGLDREADLGLDFPTGVGVPYTGPHAAPPTRIDPQSLDIHWVMPDFLPGSGGHMTIFRMVRYLEQFGHRCTIWIEKPVFNTHAAAAWDVIIKAFQCVEAQVRFVDATLQRTSGDVVIAAGWSAAWLVRDLQGFGAKMHFVQDHEPEFYPTGAMSHLAAATYGFDMGCLCASPWLEALMAGTYGRWARGFHLAYDPEVYFQDRSVRRAGPFRIAVYGRARTERRCVQLALAGLQMLARTRDDFEVHFFGQDDLPIATAPFAARNHGVLPEDRLAALYNDCDLGVCFSGTNHSLVPQEMMACGLPVVELDAPGTRAIFPDGTVTLGGPDPVGIAQAIGRLMDAPEVRKRQRAAALDWVRGFDWEDSARTVESAVVEYLGTRDVALAAPASIFPKDVVLDVVVPVLNGKAEFERVLTALRAQKIVDRMQIYCIDSQSTDGTARWLAAQNDVSLTTIDAAEFQHGRTRNLGASLGRAPFIGFLTQDACPVGPDWAYDLVTMLRAVPDAAGVFGRHIADPSHGRFIGAQIDAHFADLAVHPLVLSKRTDPAHWASGNRNWRQVLHFYSNNNSAMRRAVWRDMPYPEIEFGEDQVWARDVIDAGFSKVYAPTATVMHSHDFSPKAAYARARTEGAFFYRHFGYEAGADPAHALRQMDMVARRYGIDDDAVAHRRAVLEQQHRGWRDGYLAAKDGLVQAI